MGISVTKRTYKNGNGVTIDVTLTRMSSDGAGGFMGGLGGLAQMGMMQGEPVRIGGVKGSAMTEGREKKILLGMSGNSMFELKTNNGTIDDVDNFAKGYPVRELNAALGGN